MYQSPRNITVVHAGKQFGPFQLSCHGSKIHKYRPDSSNGAFLSLTLEDDAQPCEGCCGVGHHERLPGQIR